MFGYGFVNFRKPPSKNPEGQEKPRLNCKHLRHSPLNVIIQKVMFKSRDFVPLINFIILR
jgi:hypothetical protein